MDRSMEASRVVLLIGVCLRRIGRFLEQRRKMLLH